MSGEDPMAEDPVDQKDLETMTRAAPTAGPPTGTAGPTDQIRLTGVGGIGHHGVLEEERRDGQPFLADLVLTVDTRAAASEDDLTQTVNYAEVAQQVVAVIEGEPVNLIETLAARIAAVALSHRGVHQAAVTVHKPEAPVGVPFTDVEVTITRTAADDLPELDLAPPAPTAAPEPAAALPPSVLPPTASAAPEPAPADHGQTATGPDLHAAPEHPVPVVIALGGNVGDVRTTLRTVVADLRAMPGLTVEDVSPLARTAAVLAPDAVAQPDFLNAVVLATTTLAPKDLLDSMQRLEDAHGRRRTGRWGERTLDLDLIVYDGITSTDPDLSLPHPRASERAFVLVPWAQADPDAFLPGLGGGPVAALAETAPDRGGVRWLALDWLEEPPRPAPAPEPAAVAEPGPAREPAAAAEAGPAPEPAAVAEPTPVPAAAPPVPDGSAVDAAVSAGAAEGDSPEVSVAEGDSPGPAPGAPSDAAAELPPAVPPPPAASAEPVPPAPLAASAEPGPGADDLAPPAVEPESSSAAAGPEPVSQWAPESQGNVESQDDLELLAHGDADPEPPPPPVVPPAGRPGRASFPPAPSAPAVSPPPASAPAGTPPPEAAPAPAPWSEPELEPEPTSPPAPAQQSYPEPPSEADYEPQDEQGSWFPEPVDRAGTDPRDEPSLPWVTSPEEGQAPRLAPKWQPLRRHDDT